jgi:hypothetical protein
MLAKDQMTMKQAQLQEHEWKGIDTILEVGTAIKGIKQLVLRCGKKYYLFKNSFNNSYRRNKFKMHKEKFKSVTSIGEVTSLI